MDLNQNISPPTLNYYRESGEINAVGLTLAYIACLMVSIGLGYVYAVIIIFNPFIYFNFLACIGLGIATGYFTRLIARLTHNRNKKSRWVMAVITGLLTLLFHWLAYLSYLILGAIPSFDEYFAGLPELLLPQNSFPIVIELYQNGIWSILGMPFNGMMLGIIWLAEACIIVLIPIRLMLQMNLFPYSESQQKWYRKYTLQKNFAPVFGIASAKRISENAVEALNEMGLGMGNRHGKAHIYFLKEEQKQYISFDNVSIDRKGKSISDQVIPPLHIDKASAASVLDQFENNKESIDVF